MNDAEIRSDSETQRDAAPGHGRTKWFAFGALGVAAVAFVIIAYGGIGENLVYYWGPSELRAAGSKAVGATIRLGGQVAEGSVRHGDGASSLEFDVVDLQGTRVHVRSRGVPPQMFREGIGVVVEGTMTRAGHFECHRLMVSHDNEYRAPDDPKADMKRLMQTTQGMDDVPTSTQ
jgi:cytochrome c-type biogenesis protein CcmE